MLSVNTNAISPKFILFFIVLNPVAYKKGCYNPLVNAPKKGVFKLGGDT